MARQMRAKERAELRIGSRVVCQDSRLAGLNGSSLILVAAWCRTSWCTVVS